MAVNKIAIFGLGAIGGNVAMNLILHDPFLQIIGIDRDVVEEKNLGPQVYARTDVGLAKIDGMAARLYDVFGAVPMEFLKADVSKRMNEKIDRIVLQSDLIIDAFDNYASRDCLHRLAMSVTKQRKPIVHLGFGMSAKRPVASILWNEKYLVGQTEDENAEVCDTRALSYWIKGAAGIMTHNVLRFINEGKITSSIIFHDFSVKNLL